MAKNQEINSSLIVLEDISFSQKRLRILANLNFLAQKKDIHTIIYSSPLAYRSFVGILNAKISGQNYLGNFYFESEPKVLKNPEESLSLGIYACLEEPLIIRELSIQENLFLPNSSQEDELIDYDKEEGLTWKWIHFFNLPFSPDTLVEDIEERYYAYLEVIRLFLFPKKLLILSQFVVESLTENDQIKVAQKLWESSREGLCILYFCVNPRFLWKYTTHINLLTGGKIAESWHKERGEKNIPAELSLLHEEIKLPFSQNLDRDKEPLLIFYNWIGLKREQFSAQKINLSIHEGTFSVIGGLEKENLKELADIFSGNCLNRQPFSLIFRNKPVNFYSPAESLQERIAFISEESSLLENLSLKENLFLKAHTFLEDPKKFLEDNHLFFDKFWKDLSLPLPPQDKPVSELSLIEENFVLLAQALILKPVLLILKNTSLKLNEGDKSQYFQVIKNISQKNITVLFLTHHQWDYALIEGDKFWIGKDNSVEELLKINPLPAFVFKRRRDVY